MYKELNRLYIQLDCLSLHARQRNLNCVEGTYSFTIDLEAPSYPILKEIFDMPHEFEVYRAPFLKRRGESLRRKAKFAKIRARLDRTDGWDNYPPFSFVDPNLETRQTPWIVNRFNTDYQNCCFNDELYSEVSRLINSRIDSLVGFIALSKQEGYGAKKPYPPILESRDSLGAMDSLQVTMVYVRSANDVMSAYQRYAGHTKLAAFLK